VGEKGTPWAKASSPAILKNEYNGLMESTESIKLKRDESIDFLNLLYSTTTLCSTTVKEGEPQL
jgi:hypothetical protein